MVEETWSCEGMIEKIFITLVTAQEKNQINNIGWDSIDHSKEDICSMNQSKNQNLLVEE